MADYINNVAAADGYTTACTLGPDFQAKVAVITVANNPALLQFAVGRLGSWHWTDEREFFSIPQSFKVGNIIGVRFRNAVAGQVARILATLSGGDDDPVFESGLPFTSILSAAGGITPVSTVGQELGYAQITAVVPVTAITAATATVVVTAPAITFDGSTVALIEFFAPDVYLGAGAGSQVIIDLWDGATRLGQLAAPSSSVGDVQFPVSASARLTPLAAAHIYSVRAWRVAANGIIVAGSGAINENQPAYIRITQAV